MQLRLALMFKKNALVLDACVGFETPICFEKWIPSQARDDTEWREAFQNTSVMPDAARQGIISNSIDFGMRCMFGNWGGAGVVYSCLIQLTLLHGLV